MEKHQYGFAILNGNTDGIRKKAIWTTGENEDECRAKAREQARAYASTLTDEAYEKACRKTHGYKPSRCSYEFKVVDCALRQ